MTTTPIYAIGKPSGAVRQYVQTANDPTPQLQTGEVALNVAAIPAGFMNFNSDGSALVAGSDPSPPSLAVYQRQLISQVDTMRENLQMKYLTPGGAKKMIYSAKQTEVLSFNKLGAAAVALLNNTNQQAQFPYTYAESQLTGDSLATVQARWSTAISVSLVVVYKIEAAAITGKRRIMAATTQAAMLAAFNAIVWPTS